MQIPILPCQMDKPDTPNGAILTALNNLRYVCIAAGKKNMRLLHSSDGVIGYHREYTGGPMVVTLRGDQVYAEVRTYQL